MKPGGVQNYLNTLIFCIVAKAVTILILALVFTKLGGQLAFLLLTIELGLITIIFLALWKIHRYEKLKKEELERLLNQEVFISSCPDYFTRQVRSEAGVDQSFCINTYKTPDGSNTYQFDIGEFNIDTTFSQDKDKKKFIDYCTRLRDKNSPPNFERVAWTELKERCKASTY